MEVTVVNILDTTSVDLAMWVRDHLLQTPLPRVDANTTLSPTALVPLLSEYANSQSYATELYNVVTGYLTTVKLAKKMSAASLGGSESKTKTEEDYENLKACQDILYRTIQAVTLKYEAASRMMSGLTSYDTMSRRGS